MLWVMHVCRSFEAGDECGRGGVRMKQVASRQKDNGSQSRSITFPSCPAAAVVGPAVGPAAGLPGTVQIGPLEDGLSHDLSASLRLLVPSPVDRCPRIAAEYWADNFPEDRILLSFRRGGA